MARAKGTQLTLNLENNVLERSLEAVMPESMMIYSEHIILDRSLPRVEDGLKPVQRRILYTMHNLKMGPQSEYKKSARIVGDCMGKYHPHGDSSIYGAMVRMAQDFSMRMPLVDGQGNFGTAMGDGPAAMRYTEARLEALTMELLRDIDKDTVSWSKNFDDTLDEPDILPGRFPNLLVNGATGIAIGFSMNIPPHNLTEVIDGCVALIDNPRMKLDELLTIIKGPDFPAGGFLVGGQDLYNIYETGQGKIVLRGRAEIENEGSSQNIVITEVPWGINPKDKIIKRIYDLREKNKELYGNVVDVFDESDGTGLRIVVKLKKGEDAVRVLDGLYKNTDLQCNFPVNMVAIADGKPRQLGLIPMLKYYLNYQKSVIYKRSKFDLNVAEKRAEVLEGYRIIMPNIDEVIAIIRGASTRAEAKTKLRERFTLSEAQAEAILSLQLGNINKLDVHKFENELNDLNKQIAELNKILSSDREQFKVVKKELQEIRDKYKCKRLTTIINSVEDLDIKPQVFDPTKRTNKRCIVAIAEDGSVKVLSTRNFISANRDVESSGLDGLTKDIHEVKPDNTVLVFGSQGNCYKLNVNAVGEKQWKDKGDTLNTLYPTFASKEERAIAVLSANPDELDNEQVYIYTKYGMVKKSLFRQYFVAKEAYQVMSLKEDDEVIGVEIVKENSTIVFVTSDGQCVNSEVDDYPLHGRIAGGVIGVNLNTDAHVVFAGQAEVELGLDADGKEAYMPLGEIVVITDKGTGKKVIASEFSPMKRARKGLRIIDIYGEPYKVAFASLVLTPYKLAFVDEENNLHEVDTEEIRIERKDTKGKPILRGIKVKKVVKHVEEME